MKDIILFGASEFGRKAYDFYSNDSKTTIVAFCDNDTKKHHTKFLDIVVIPAQKIADISYDEIVICSSYDDEILKQLLKMNIEKSKIKLFTTNTLNAHLKDGDKMLMAKELMFYITDLLNITNVKYHIDHGTLLGIIRDKKILPWDIDIDIAILDSELELTLDLLSKELLNFKSKYCTNNQWRFELHHIKMKLEKEETLPMVIKIYNDSTEELSKDFSLDIELKHQFQKKLYWMIGSRKLVVPANICFDTKEHIFEGKTIQIPKRSESYLKELYGEWKTPVKEWSYNQYTNISETKKTVLFGASEFGKKALHHYNQKADIEIIAFCDNDAKIHHQTIENITIISPERLLELNPDSIIITSIYEKEIYKQLIDMGIKKNKIKIASIDTISSSFGTEDKLQMAHELLLFVCSLFNDNNIEYHLDHGSLLGVVRDNTLLPWDKDIDFAMPISELKKILEVLPIFLPSFKSKHCSLNNWTYKQREDESITLGDSTKIAPITIKIFNDCSQELTNDFDLDIKFKYKYDNKLFWKVGIRTLSADINNCFPSKSILFQDRMVKVPNKREKYLKHLYGEWKTPVKEWTYNQYTNIEEK